MGKYDSIIDFPHKQSTRRSHMAPIDRAAQFAPFAALVGYDSAVHEAGRLTEERRDLTESALEELNDRLIVLHDNLSKEPVVSITHFVADKRKNGGAYITSSGVAIRVDDYTHTVTLENGAEISIDDILEIEGDIFAVLGSDM